jgi:hypothetical protein
MHLNTFDVWHSGRYLGSGKENTLKAHPWATICHNGSGTKRQEQHHCLHDLFMSTLQTSNYMKLHRVSVSLFPCLVWRRHAPSAQCQQVWHDASNPTSQLVTSLNVLLTGWCTRSSRAWSIRASCQGVPLQYYAARSIFSRLKKSFAQNPAILSLPASEFFTSVARFHDQRPQLELSLPHVSSVNTEMHGH